MRLKEETQDSLCSLKLSDVPTEWINSVWDGNFCTEAVTLPYEAVEEEVLLCEDSWERLVEACRHWPQTISSNESKLPKHQGVNKGHFSGWSLIAS